MTRLEYIKQMNVWELATLLVQGRDEETCYDLYGEIHKSACEAIRANVEWLEADLKGGDY